jgi:hypothetical protein
LFKSHVLSSASLFVYHAVSRVNYLGYTKVSQVEGNWDVSMEGVLLTFLIASYENISLFYIEVSYVLSVNILNSVENLPEDNKGAALLQGLGVVDQFVERSILGALQ